MKLETGILLLREFHIGLQVHAELVAHSDGVCVVRARAMDLHFPKNPTRIAVEEVTYRIHRHADIVVGANLVNIT